MPALRYLRLWRTPPTDGAGVAPHTHTRTHTEKEEQASAIMIEFESITAIQQSIDD